MRRFITCKENAKNNVIYDVNGLSLNNVIHKVPDVTEQFHFEKVVCSSDGREAIGFTDPIRILFNQKRLDNLTSREIDNLVDSFKQYTNDPLAELRSKCSDADLKKIIKSKHIQQPCEITAWAMSCAEDMENFSNELKALQEASNTDSSVKSETGTIETETIKSE